MENANPTDLLEIEHMRRAIALSERSVEEGGGPFGAVVVADGRIVGEGWNQVTLNHDPTAHAEIVAIRDACSKLGHFSLAGATIYTSCEPCPMCFGAIHWARIARIVFGNDRHDAKRIGFDDELLYREVALPLAARAMPVTQMLAEEARRAFDAWVAKEDRTDY